uniref:(northern house mosquito) hypothetical protein n=1 Tax=Culex pipiens TaxID=7175 RepID=A0A8D8NGT7_CULPI
MRILFDKLRKTRRSTRFALPAELRTILQRLQIHLNVLNEPRINPTADPPHHLQTLPQLTPSVIRLAMFHQQLAVVHESPCHHRQKFLPLSQQLTASFEPVAPLRPKLRQGAVQLVALFVVVAEECHPRVTGQRQQGHALVLWPATKLAAAAGVVVHQVLAPIDRLLGEQVRRGASFLRRLDVFYSLASRVHAVGSFTQR